MRIRALAYSLTGCAAALAHTWEIRQAATPSHVAQSAPPSAAAAPTGSPTSSASGTSSAAPSKTSGGSAGTFTGSTAQTAYGPVQVAIVVKSGRITDVNALQLTNQGGRSVAISAGAAPILRNEALRAQSAKIDTVSGASYTSDGYRTSLQSAIDKARL